MRELVMSQLILRPSRWKENAEWGVSKVGILATAGK